MNTKGIDLSGVHAICSDCARMLGFERKDKAVGVWMGDCEVCHRRRACTDLWHDWKKARNWNNRRTPKENAK